jgi:serine protease
LLAALLLGIAGAATAQTATAPVKKPAASAPEPMVGQLMVKLRAPTASERVQRLGAQRVSALSKSAGLALESVRPMAGDATVVRLPQPMPLSQAQAVIERLRADADVEWAAPDLPVRRQQTQVPPDQGFATLQWNLFAPTTAFATPTTAGGTKVFTPTGGANLPAAWARSVGSASVTVAVIDTGVALGHRDLRGRMLPGYDFVSSAALQGDQPNLPANFVSNDGDGRDADPSDPGDWVTAAEESQYPVACRNSTAPSSWHGTHMAGIVAAQWGNDVDTAINTIRPGTRLAGIGPALRILPIRALGKCGGTSSDVIDAMYWAVGLPVTGVQTNPNPARVINLSLGGLGGACVAGTTYFDAINAVLRTGAIVLAATGNGGEDGIGDEGALQPANCPGVFGITAHSVNGDSAVYANTARRTNLSEVLISAPGGGAPFQLPVVPPLEPSDNANVIWSTGLFGATIPTSPVSATDTRSGDSILGLTGTSPATPQVAATVAMMLSVNPALTRDQVRGILVASARPHPPGTYCGPGQPGETTCGAGLLDAGAALALLQPTAPAVPPAAPPLPPEPVPPPPPSGGGGGSLPLAPVLLLLALSLARQVRQRGER